MFLNDEKSLLRRKRIEFSTITFMIQKIMISFVENIQHPFILRN